MEVGEDGREEEDEVGGAWVQVTTGSGVAAEEVHAAGEGAARERAEESRVSSRFRLEGRKYALLDHIDEGGNLAQDWWVAIGESGVGACGSGVKTEDPGLRTDQACLEAEFTCSSSPLLSSHSLLPSSPPVPSHP
jgi:hypothetical protein